MWTDFSTNILGVFLGSLDNLKGAMDVIFPGLSNAIDINPETLDMLSTNTTPEDFLSSDQKDIEKCVSKRRSEKNKEDCFSISLLRFSISSSLSSAFLLQEMASSSPFRDYFFHLLS